MGSSVVGRRVLQLWNLSRKDICADYLVGDQREDGTIEILKSSSSVSS